MPYTRQRGSAYQIVEQIQRIVDAQHTELFYAMRDDAEGTMRLARDVYCPISDDPEHRGTLRASARVHGRERRGAITVQISFGDAAAFYAAAVHNRLDLRHTPPTQAMYLQRAVDERARTMPARLARRMNAASRRAAR